MKPSECRVKVTADVVGGKWKRIIFNALKANPLLFGDLVREVPEATRKIATSSDCRGYREVLRPRISKPILRHDCSDTRPRHSCLAVSKARQ
jgi:hypothetical protein